MMTHQILLVINGLLLGVLILSLYFVVRNRTQAHRDQVELKDARKELEILKDQVGDYRDRAVFAESKLENALKKLEHDLDMVYRLIDRYHEQDQGSQDKEDTREEVESDSESALSIETRVTVSVFQGEREQVKGNELLCQFDLEGIPLALRGKEEIKMIFNINEDGILSVSAMHGPTGKEQSVRVTGQSGFSEEEMERLIKDAAAHA